MRNYIISVVSLILATILSFVLGYVYSSYYNGLFYWLGVLLVIGLLIVSRIFYPKDEKEDTS